MSKIFLKKVGRAMSRIGDWEAGNRRKAPSERLDAFGIACDEVFVQLIPSRHIGSAPDRQGNPSLFTVTACFQDQPLNTTRSLLCQKTCWCVSIISITIARAGFVQCHRNQTCLIADILSFLNRTSVACRHAEIIRIWELM